jgi:ubiquinone/menaquinone biosynthesis C-methylase UbiE
MIVAVALVLSAAFTRGAENEVDHLAQVLDLRPGSSVADVGAGDGELSIAMAIYVGPQGVVYSTEINPKLLDKIRSEAQKAGARNLIPILGKEHVTELPDNCCDAIFLRRVYHHLTDPVGIDRSLYMATRPGGRLAIIDFEPSEQPGQPVPPGVLELTAPVNAPFSCPNSSDSSRFSGSDAQSTGTNGCAARGLLA